MDRLQKLAVLLTEGIGPVRFRRLMERFGSIEEIVNADIRDLLEILPEKVAFRVKNPDVERARNQVERAERMGVRIIFQDEEEYPQELRNIYHAPPVLFARGNMDLLRERKVAIVGTRKPTQYGLKMAYRFASELSEAGVVIVSGGAVGIDARAHEGAMPRTIVVLGSGIDHLYPRSNLPLFRKVLKSGGLIISQFPMGTGPSKETFPVRNLTIAGMSLAVLMVEGTQDSGALITARYAFDFDREVFTVPNRVDVPQGKGPYVLIRENVARVVEKPADILRELGLGSGVSSSREVVLEGLEKEVFDAIVGRVHFDELLMKFGNYSRLSMALLNLELKGLIEKLPGNYYQRK